MTFNKNKNFTAANLILNVYYDDIVFSGKDDPISKSSAKFTLH